MIKISENKINLKQNILEQLLILQKQNEMDDNCPASIQQIQKIISPLNKCIKNMKDNKDIYLINNQNREPISEIKNLFKNEELFKNFLGEPKEQKAPISFCSVK